VPSIATGVSCHTKNTMTTTGAPRLGHLRLFGLCLLIGLSVASTRGSAGDKQPSPANPDGKPIDFAHEVVPILQKRCAKCHAGTQRKGGFSINTRQSLISGGETGPAAVARKSDESPLVERVTSEDPGLRMPPEGERLTAEQTRLLKRWIDAGLPWEDGFAFGKITRQAPLPPRRPAVPDGRDMAGLTNPIDRFLHGYLSERKVSATATVPDEVFARRAALDLTGLVPSPDALETFLTDARSDKRDRLVDRLLDDRAAYATHWLTFWNDLLRNAYHGTGFIDGGRRQITSWLFGSLYANKPYDRFVKELVSPAPESGSDGFTYGIKWRGTVNESQRREIQAAQSVAQVFLGTNIKCASCHDSFVNHWKLTDAYGLASIFAEGPLELHRCDQPTGVPSTVRFLYPQLGEIDAKAPQAERARQLAEMMTHPENGRLTRTIVNRLWGKLFGRGLVEPLDNMDAEPWHQDLLDYLATDLADHGYDLKRTLRLMATSRAYQLPGVGHTAASDGGAEFIFHGPLVKRATAEQFVDAVFELTNAWPACDTPLLKRDGRSQGGQLGEVARALADLDQSDIAPDRQPLSASTWIWLPPDAAPDTKPRTAYFRRVWNLEERPTRATATFTAVDAFELFVNGKLVKKSADWRKPVQVDVTDALAAGPNVIAVKVDRTDESKDAAGVIGEVYTLGTDGRRAGALASDQSWHASLLSDPDWLKPDFEAGSWKGSVELGEVAAAPWDLARIIANGGTGVLPHAPLPEQFRIRGALLPLDGLQSALGRPSREQVVSVRDSVPTLLQALQLTNGTILSKYLAQGAAYWHAAIGADPPQLIERVYRTALSRSPSGEERRLALEIVGSSPDIAAIEDLLWAIAMLPEFQMVP
jgi:Protein of unknown function (DUF1549)/Protein of unknown function (DUF1553)/Planctomycete cytochrome C